MTKVKVPKKSTRIDMTAMSDVTVLLLTFFMLTSTFIKKEPVQVNTPGSVSEIKIPETNILQVLVDPHGKVFLSLDKQSDMAKLLEAVGKDFGVQFTNEEISKFKLLPTFGVPIKDMKAFLSLKPEDQDKILKNYGVPIDSTNNEFKVWIKNARQINPDLKIAIKADQTTPYKVVKTVMSSLQDIRENRYYLITSLKKEEENK